MLSELSIVSVAALEAAMLRYEQADCPVVHHFGPGIYIRELHMKAGTYAVGHHQKHPHINILLKGAVLAINGDGTTKELRAPLTFVGQPGRKVGYILEDMVWQNVYATTETDINKLESMFLDKTSVWQSSKFEPRKLRFNKLSDHQDFSNMLVETGFTAEQVSQISNNEEDCMPMPQGSWGFKLDQSGIHGVGVFATRPHWPGEVLGPARVDVKRTPLGRYTNHSSQPNAEMVCLGNKIWLVATKYISGCKGGQNGDEVTIDYRKSVAVVRGASK